VGRRAARDQDGHRSYAVAALTIAGAIAGTVVAAFAGGLVNQLLRMRTKDPTKGTAGWLAQKGPWAIGLMGPLLVAGICVWTTAVTALTVHGFEMMAGAPASSTAF
jgi:hypothetical protein